MKKGHMTRPITLIIVLLLPLVCLQVTGAGADVRVDISADRDNVRLGEQVRVVISVQGSDNAAEPDFPKSESYSAYYRGQSSRFEVVNGRFSSSLDFTYTIVPIKEGTITIPAIPVRVGGETHHTEPLTIAVSSRAQSPDASPPERMLFATAAVDDQEPFVNQQIIYTLRLFRRVQIQGASLEPLEFNGFRMERLGKEREYRQVVDGVNYTITELRYALFPQRSGVLAIPPARLQCQVMYPRKRGRSRLDSFFDDPFFGGFGRTEIKTEFISTQPTQLHVKPMPHAEDPGLATHLVGSFSVNAHVSANELKVGDSATLTIEVMGKGNVHDIPGPSIPDLPEFKVYEDNPTLDVTANDEGISGVKTFKMALVPTTPGEYRFPPLRIPFLDPDTGAYRTASAPSFMLKVHPGAEEERLHLVEGGSPTVKKEEIRLLGRDILPVKTSLDSLRDQSVSWGNPLLLLMIILPPLAYFTLFGWERKRRRMAADQGSYRRKNAYREWKRNRTGIPSPADRDPQTFYTQSLRAVRQFLGDRLGIDAQALTTQEINRKLENTRMPDQARDHLNTLLRTLEQGAFGSLRQGPDEREALLNDVDRFVNQVIRWT
ncbi:MAG: BatD family protein [bacterium]